MDELDRYLDSHLLEAMAWGTFIKFTMSPLELFVLAQALGREPGWKECLRHCYEKTKHEDFLRDKKQQELQLQEQKDKQAIHRLIWGKGN